MYVSDLPIDSMNSNCFIERHGQDLLTVWRKCDGNDIIIIGFQGRREQPCLRKSDLNSFPITVFIPRCPLTVR
jgi:hypothetical protein